MLKVLITGYSGFLGSHLLNILKDDFKLCLLGRSTPNISCDFLHASIDDISDYSSILIGVDVVIHVAAVSAFYRSSCMKEIEQINIHGTFNLAKQSAKIGVKRFIFVSSIKVNGENTEFNNLFTHLDLRCPKEYYGLSKAEAEKKLELIASQSTMDYVIIRPPLIYGEGVKSNFKSLFKLVGLRIPLPFRAINNNKRSLVSVYNLVDLIKVCIEHPKASNQIFLVSDDNDISTSEMVALMARVQEVNNYSFPFPIWCFHLLGRLLNKQEVIDRLIGSLQVDISHTKETLDWKPPYSVEEGFAKCVGNKKGKK